MLPCSLSVLSQFAWPAIHPNPQQAGGFKDLKNLARIRQLTKIFFDILQTTSSALA